jgi:hypothetical protein
MDAAFIACGFAAARCDIDFRTALARMVCQPGGGRVAGRERRQRRDIAGDTWRVGPTSLIEADLVLIGQQ